MQLLVMEADTAKPLTSAEVPAFPSQPCSEVDQTSWWEGAGGRRISASDRLGSASPRHLPASVLHQLRLVGSCRKRPPSHQRESVHMWVEAARASRTAGTSHCKAHLPPRSPTPAPSGFVPLSRLDPAGAALGGCSAGRRARLRNCAESGEGGPSPPLQSL